MSKTFDQGKDEVAALCDYFAKNRLAFCAPNRKEAHVRQDLIDPLFRALGWDVGNTARVAPQYCEVIVEDSLDVEGQQKAPDYTFRVGTLPKFYAEAKKCGVNIFADPAPAYQLRRYGWSAKVAVSILTDFEELGVYDCTIRPRQGDKASHARILFFRFDQYVDRWRELWDTFSREAVWSGGFDQYAASKRKRGTSEVDVEFLREIEGWRDELARNIALRNPSLSADELNHAVQVTIDRIVFLRMAEDRGLEPNEQLLSLCGQAGIYDGYMKLCRKADDKYNSGLFHFQNEPGVAEAPDSITPRLAVDDKTLKPILQSLYFAHGSPYEFKVLPVEILGTVYERFLGKVIRLTPGHQARIEEKPEVRKAGGVYYTPSYIVDYIVAQTVGRQIEGKSPAQLAGKGKAQPLRVLDMACGSGSFLLGAYQCLLDHCLKWYIDNKPQTFPKALYLAREGDWRLTIAEKKRILLTHVYGVDIDAQAVEVSKLSLLLKVLEGESAQTVGDTMKLFHERALPNLSDNIKCGNSLIGPDYFTGRLIPDAAEFARVNAFDWRREFPGAMAAGGFDCVIGNPPYVRQEELASSKAYFEAHYSTYQPTADIYVNFIEKAHALLNCTGLFGMIVSNKWLRAAYGAPLRAFFTKAACLRRVLDLAGLPVFGRATVRTAILISSKGPSPKQPLHYLPPPTMDDFRAVQSGHQLAAIFDKKKQTLPKECLSPDGWSFSGRAATRIINRMRARSVALVDFIGGKPYLGIKTGANDAFIVDKKTRNRLVSENSKCEDLLVPVVAGRDVRRYRVDFKHAYLIRTFIGVPIDKYAPILRHLGHFKDRLVRRCDQGHHWWELRACDYYARFGEPKIIYPDIATSCRFVLDRSGYYGTNTTYFIPTNDPWLLGILNSKLGQFYFSETCAGLEGNGQTYLRFFGQYLERFPVRRLDMSKSNQARAHSHMVRLVDSMLAMHKQLASAKGEGQRVAIGRQIDATDREIDRLVYELYGLTKDEIAVVEGLER
jgi:SAM-dependent methyltransferase